MLTTGGDTLGLYHTTHDWWRYLRALPDYSRLVPIPESSTGGDSQVSILIIYLWELRAFTPENYSRLQASPLTSRLVKLGEYARVVAIP